MEDSDGNGKEKELAGENGFLKVSEASISSTNCKVLDSLLHSLNSYLLAIPQTLQLASSMNSAADQPTVERSIHTSPMQQLRWHRAACSDTHRTGFGLIIRDVQGDLLFAACYKPLSKFNPTLAEASCFRWAFETDCSMLTKIWHSPVIIRVIFCTTIADSSSNFNGDVTSTPALSFAPPALLSW